MFGNIYLQVIGSSISKCIYIVVMLRHHLLETGMIGILSVVFEEMNET